MHLTAILSNPPTTSGERTLGRVGLAARVLNHDTFSVANLFPVATHRTGGITMVGTEESNWHRAREALQEALDQANTVLLAYGVEEPKGLARVHFRQQLVWLKTEIEARELAVVSFGERTRHPSRWQRHTFRAYPDLPFEEAARLALTGTELATPFRDEASQNDEENICSRPV